MGRFAHAAVIAAGVAAASMAGVPVRAADLAPSLQSFAASKTISAYEMSAAGVSGVALQPEVAASIDNSAARLATVAYGAPLSHISFATSTPLSFNLALDAGQDLDVAARFTNYGQSASPLLSVVTAPYLGLANGGRYSGVTFVPASNLRLRMGAAINSERLDQFSFDPIASSGNLALTYDASQSRSLLAGLSWDISSAIGLDVTGISSDRSGVPLGYANAGGIARHASTNALSVSARMALGQGWVTTASFSEGMTQLDRRDALGNSLNEQSYSIAVAKHGLFGGDDSVGLSLSRPAPSMAGSFSSLVGSGDLPPLVISPNQALSPRAPETDFSVGYVTNFLDGAVALQTNAAYQTNAQGQPGATSVSLLSRAKIKF